MSKGFAIQFSAVTFFSEDGWHQQSYCLAHSDVLPKDAPPNAIMAVVVGSREIFETTREARKLADLAGRPVAFDFSGLTVVVGPGDDPDAVARSWWQQLHGCTPEQSAER